MLQRLSPDVRQYLLITGNYWAFTLTDGALRMLVVHDAAETIRCCAGSKR